MKECLILFTRYPEIGRTKTRLIPALGETGAARLHNEMAKHILIIARRAQLFQPFELEVRHDGGNTGSMAAWLGSGMEFRPQCQGDLGQRMENAFEESFARGYSKVVIMGTDCPSITSAIIEQAFKILTFTDLVLGPATDGGYYLIGLRRPASVLFQNIPWETGSVLSLTKLRAKTGGLTLCLLPPLTDVDRPEDLPVWESAKRQVSANIPELISVIIPTLNEETRIREVLDSVHRGSNVEAIVIDGGSYDDTKEAANFKGATVIPSAKGRAKQMNTGAAVATGNFLLFLHGDTLLPKGYDSRIRKILHNNCVAGGAFQLGIEDDRWALRIIEHLANWRSILLNLPYGDQGIFLQKERFMKLGGFPDLPLLEDVKLIRTLGRQGKIVIAPERVSTSATRWQNLGILKTTLINQLIMLGYVLGISPGRLAALRK